MLELNLKDFLNFGAFLQTGPNQFKILIGPFKNAAISSLEDLKKSTLLLKPNFWDFLGNKSISMQNTVYYSEKSIELSREEFVQFVSQQLVAKPDIQWFLADEAAFKYQYDWSQAQFTENKLQKTVPIICQNGESSFSEKNILWCLKNLLENNNFGWSYGYFEFGTGFLGHTPEILAHWNQLDRQLHTVALAGTYSNVPGARVEILQDKKILNEHQLVIDDITEKLNLVGLNSKCIQGATDVLELKYLLHLMTEFQIEVGSLSEVLKTIETLHPTSAMGVYPNNLEKLIEFSKLNLQKQRNNFAAPFAFINSNSVSAVVAIRNMSFKPGLVTLFSGCGVTIDSDYNTELIELKNKRESVKKMLGL